ncbi:MAG TPA: antibiotic biosynthesis monooxygenase [Anaerolineales bacterium]|nr:antibiotic biosynthesis monooxygenase [Anaerolineales bacterium]
MSEPLIVMSTFRVKEGKLEDFTRYYTKILEIVKANEPQIIAFHGFLNKEATEMTSMQVHPDADSMDFHMRVLRDNWDETVSNYGQMLEILKVEYFGTPPESALTMDMQGEYDVHLKPYYVAGFTCSTAG